MSADKKIRVSEGVDLFAWWETVGVPYLWETSKSVPPSRVELRTPGTANLQKATNDRLKINQSHRPYIHHQLRAVLAETD